jgi:hypothetical protein
LFPGLFNNRANDVARNRGEKLDEGLDVEAFFAVLGRIPHPPHGPRHRAVADDNKRGSLMAAPPNVTVATG